MKPKRLKNGKSDKAGFVYEKIDYRARNSAKESSERPLFHGGAQGSPARATLGKGSVTSD
jgi:hypothetical protein